MNKAFQTFEHFYIKSYSLTSFREEIAINAKTSLQIIESKRQVCYLYRYLSDLNCKTFLVEKDYIDRAFLEDFTNNFVKCFHSYSPRCTRLHFFETAFVSDDFEDILRGNDKKSAIDVIRKAYLGFMVVKPLPKTVIGRVCLKTYAREASRGITRYYPATRSYKPTLFGINFDIENSLAFQEQDFEVGVCATSALWSLFQGTGILYHHPILSPGEITKASIGHKTIDNILSSDGLSSKQIANAIRSVGLKPLVLDQFENKNYLKRVIYAYLKAKIPMIMGFELLDTTTSSTDKEQKGLGYHAVVVNGFSIGDHYSSTTKGDDGKAICLKSSRMAKLYVHDDKIGPFARMIFDADEDLLAESDIQEKGLLLDRSLEDNEHLRANPNLLIIPLYHKIRILSEDIFKIVADFNAYVNTLRIPNIIEKELEWDIYLTTVNDYKNSIINSTDLDEETRIEVLLESMPKYIWHASSYCNKNRMLDLLFDATDIKQGKIFVRAIEYDLDFSIILRTTSQSPEGENRLKTIAAKAIIEWFRAQT